MAGEEKYKKMQIMIHGEYRVMEEAPLEGYIKPNNPVAGFKVKNEENCNKVYDIEIAEKYATVNPNEIKNEKEGKFIIEKPAV